MSCLKDVNCVVCNELQLWFVAHSFKLLMIRTYTIIISSLFVSSFKIVPIIGKGTCSKEGNIKLIPCIEKNYNPME